MSIHYFMQKAHELHQSGRLNDAVKIYEDLDENNPNNADIHHYLGLAKFQLGQHKAGMHLLEKAITLEPDNNVYRGNYGSALLEENEFELAKVHLEVAVQLQPNNYNFHNDLAVAYKQLGDNEQAIIHYQISLHNKPDFSLAHKNLGVLYTEINDTKNALNHFMEALNFSPNDPIMYINVAKVLNIIGEHNNAIDYLSKALSINPDIYSAHANMGYALMRMKNYQLAERHFKFGMKKYPDSPAPYVDYADLLSLLYNYNEAIEHYKKALSIEQNNLVAHVNLGNTLKDVGSFNEAVVHYKHALLIDQNNANAHHGLGYEYLRKGEYGLGWIEHEWRFKAINIRKSTGCTKRYDVNEWDGTSLKNKTLFLYAEQGIGDVIQFVRYIPEISTANSQIILACHEELHSLLTGMKGLSKIIGLDEEPDDYDFQCPLLSLPLKLNTTLATIPDKTPYIKIEKKHIALWKKKINKKSGVLKVGIVWAGNPAFIRDRSRSPGFKIFHELLSLEDIDFYSLQMGAGAEELSESKDSDKVIDLTTNVKNFKDSAALMSGLDLIISSCTAPLHLAGALGLPTWAILSKSSDWRWMLDRDDTPWYPTMRLFRSTDLFGWENLIKNIKEELEQLKK